METIKTIIEDTCFGDVELSYMVRAIDGENPQQVVQVEANSPTGRKVIGIIFGTRIRAVTKEDVEKNCSYDYITKQRLFGS